jgi:hypothetical protein
MKMKRLASLKVCGVSVRLGTDWTGYIDLIIEESNDSDSEESDSDDSDSDDSEIVVDDSDECD